MNELDRIGLNIKGEVPTNSLAIILTSFPVSKNKVKHLDKFINKLQVDKGMESVFKGGVLEKVKNVMEVVTQSNIDRIVEGILKEEDRLVELQKVADLLPNWMFSKVNTDLDFLDSYSSLGWVEDMYSETRGWDWWSSFNNKDGWLVCLRLNCLPYQVGLFLYLLYAAGAKDVNFIDSDGKVYNYTS